MIVPTGGGKKRVIVCTNYRSGSTSFCEEYIKQNKIPRTRVLGECFGSGLFAGIPFKKTFNNLCSYDKFFVKFMPSHVYFAMDKSREILSKADLIVYLYRKDFISQAKSFVSADRTGSFYAGSDSPTIVKVPSVDESYVRSLTTVLKKNYECMAELRQEFPGPTYCYEDIHNNRPYNKTTIWTNEPDIEPFNVEGLFKEDELAT
jgi:hypothetical protein